MFQISKGIKNYTVVCLAVRLRIQGHPGPLPIITAVVTVLDDPKSLVKS